MSELTIKQMIDVALEKDINPPDEATGLVLYESSGTISNSEFTGKGAKGATDPTDDELEVINSFALTPQEKSNWTILRNIDPVGDPNLVDSHSDVFASAAMKDMMSQAVGTPILYDHSHSLDGTPPLGQVIGAKISKGRLKETWALPKEDYNSSMVKGIMNGTVNKISVGAFIDPKDKVCNSCGDKSIYSMECPHIPGRLDPKTGEVTTVTIRRVKRYAERSLVNIPARLGTGMKSMDQAPDQEAQLKEVLEEVEENLKDILDAPLFEKGGLLGTAAPLRPYDALSKEPEHTKVMMKQFSVMKKHESSSPPVIMDLPLDYEDVYLQILVPEGKDLTGANGLGIQNFVTDKPYEYFKFNDTPAASTHLLQARKGEAFVPQIVIDHKLFPDNESVNEGNFVLSVFCSRKELAPTPPATIPDVINTEEDPVAEKNEKAPEAQEPSEKEEVAPVEAPAAEDKTEAPEIAKSEVVEVPVVKSLEIEELTKSFQEPVVKALAEFNEKFAQLHELQEKNAKDLGALTETVTKIAQHVVELAQFSSEDVINQVIELVSQLKDQKSAEPVNKAPDNFNDFVSSLVAKK